MKLKLTMYLSILTISICYYGIGQNMYDLSAWQVGTGSITDFNIYGTNDSNVRELGLNHVGQEVVLWKGSPNTVSNADGGIYAHYNDIDNSKTYRLSVWIKKTNSNDGTTYFGCISYTNGNYQTFRLEGTLDNNPYFWYGDLPELDHWYLLVGYVHPHDYSGSSLGKIYDGETGEVVQNTIRDFKFTPVANNLRLRTFLYADPNLDDRQYLYEPRMELVDGTEASIEELLYINSDSKLLFSYDAAGNQTQRFYCENAGCTVPPPPAFAPDNTKELVEKSPEIVEEPDALTSEDTLIEEGIVIYPNPTNGIVNLDFGNSELSHEITVYNSNGAVLYTFPNSSENSTSFDLTQQASGIYLVHIHLSDGKVINKQIIKN
ncbi:MAG: T9SS type A sorting domain-containing protein [Flavobacteriaceae bacterium]|nr:T9SS type A sorting domain-containing protein [Flavobacteriaceae bacterium]